MKCNQGRELVVLESVAGWYIGAMEKDEEVGVEFPYCRMTNYFGSRAEAQKALEEGRFAMRVCAENDYCSKGLGCLFCDD